MIFGSIESVFHGSLYSFCAFWRAYRVQCHVDKCLFVVLLFSPSTSYSESSQLKASIEDYFSLIFFYWEKNNGKKMSELPLLTANKIIQKQNLITEFWVHWIRWNFNQNKTCDATCVFTIVYVKKIYRIFCNRILNYRLKKWIRAAARW